MNPDALVDEVLMLRVLNGGDFWQMLDRALDAGNVADEQKQRLRTGAEISYAQLQGADLERLWRKKGAMSRLRDELAAILRW